MTETESIEEADESGTEQAQISISEFFESVPPNQRMLISNIKAVRKIQGRYTDAINTPEIQLHCTNEACNGTRFFRCVNGVVVKLNCNDSFHKLNREKSPNNRRQDARFLFEHPGAAADSSRCL